MAGKQTPLSLNRGNVLGLVSNGGEEIGERTASPTRTEQASQER